MGSQKQSSGLGLGSYLAPDDRPSNFVNSATSAEEYGLYLAMEAGSLNKIATEALGKAVVWRGRAMLTLSEFADLSGFAVYTVRDWAKRGVIPTVKIGGSLAVPTEQFLGWLEANTRYPKGYAPMVRDAFSTLNRRW